MNLGVSIKMMKIYLFLLAISIWRVFVSGYPAQAQGVSPLNVVLIVADDLGARDFRSAIVRGGSTSDSKGHAPTQSQTKIIESRLHVD